MVKIDARTRQVVDRFPFFVIVGIIVALAFLLRSVTTEKPVVINDTPVPPVPTLDFFTPASP